MKKYRFRGKHNGKWVYGRLTYKLVELEMGTAAIDAIIDENYEVYAVPPDTVGQSIGKHDKNGNEIFTGDVIRDTLSNGDTHDFVIDYWAVFSRFRAKAIDAKVLYAPELNQASMNDKEIIGNIYDNPEFLGDKQTELFVIEAKEYEKIM